MYIKGKVFTLLDILFLGMTALLLILPLGYNFYELLVIQGRDVLESLAESLIHISAVWVAVSVIALIWTRHRSELKEKIGRCHEQITKPLMVSLALSWPYGTEITGIPKEYRIETSSILDKVKNGELTLVTPDIEFVLKDCKDETEVRNWLEHWRSLKPYRHQIIDLCSTRILRNKELYTRGLEKNIKTIRHLLKEYDEKLAILVYDVFKLLDDFRIGDDRTAKEYVEQIILYRVGLRKQHVESAYDNLVEAEKDAVLNIISQIRNKVEAVKERKNKLCLTLLTTKKELEDYIEEMRLDFPEGYIPEFEQPNIENCQPSPIETEEV